MRSARVAPADCREDATGGSTGVPLKYWSGPRERAWRLSGQEFHLRRLGIRSGDSTALLWGHHIDLKERSNRRDRLRDALTGRRWFDCFRLSPEILLQYHAELEKFRPTMLLSYASALDTLATVLLERGLKATYPARRIITGAEKLWPTQRSRIEQTFTVPVHEQYGSRDVGLMAYQLDPAVSLSFEVDWANVLIEPAGDSRESEILVTKLNADAMPMIRYRVGDAARFSAGSAPGHPSWELEEILGRQLDRLMLPDGRWLHPVGIMHLLKDFPVREFQFLQGADYDVQMNVVPLPAFSPNDESRLLSVLADNLPGIRLRFSRVDQIDRGGTGKWRPVISNVASGAAPRAERGAPV